MFDRAERIISSVLERPMTSGLKTTQAFSV
jgi:hypothetical protein